jgi:hypothetical protein
MGMQKNYYVCKELKEKNMSSSATDLIYDTTEVVAEVHWAKKGDVGLCVYRKYSPSVGEDGKRPVLMLVHGSS